MACGTAVVAGNNSSLPEVLGSAALLVDAEDTDAITEAMATALGNASLRVRLADMGRAQAARFSWESAAQQLLRAYELVGH
jgi:glycosyltransferase involved in cell wall biosynthesis